jgi:ketosteroid isomerase-like protein
MTGTEQAQQVAAAADALVHAFGNHNRDDYFAAFDSDATFLFYNSQRRFDSRAEYETEWRSWEADGFRVVGCTSTDQHVQLLAADVAVFTHRVATRVHVADGDHDLAERETIVFRRTADGRWLGVHEHLSPAS